MGAWIETGVCAGVCAGVCVAPRVGAWIETSRMATAARIARSHPVWVRGLKLIVLGQSIEVKKVAPRVGAWIETHLCRVMGRAFQRRTPCGCVD